MTNIWHIGNMYANILNVFVIITNTITNYCYNKILAEHGKGPKGQCHSFAYLLILDYPWVYIYSLTRLKA